MTSFIHFNRRRVDHCDLETDSMDPSPQNSSSATGNGGLSASASATPSPAPNPTLAVASAPVDEAKQNLNQVISSIDKTLGLLHQLYITVSSFSVASQLPLLQRLNALVSELDAMQKMADKCNVQIPLEVVNLIDDGKNPDEFTKDVINSCVAKNQITKGKTDAFKSFRKHLLEELDHAFPDEVDMYREIRSSAAESRRPAQFLQTLPNGDVKIKSDY